MIVIAIVVIIAFAALVLQDRHYAFLSEKHEAKSIHALSEEVQEKLQELGENIEDLSDEIKQFDDVKKRVDALVIRAGFKL